MSEFRGERKPLKATKNGYSQVVFYSHPSGWILRPKGEGWKVGQNQYETKARFAEFDTLDEARAFCDEHSNWPWPDECRVCGGPLEGAPGPECDDTGCPERDGSSTSTPQKDHA